MHPQRSRAWRHRSFAFGILMLAALLSRLGMESASPQATSAPEVKPASFPMRALGAMQPRLAADGRNVVLSYHGSIWRLPATGGVLRRLYSGPGHATEPCWSPDGKRVACLVGPTWQQGELKLLEADTGAEIKLPVAVQGSGKLYFTPDGRRIVGKLRTLKQIEAVRAYDIETGAMETLLRASTFRQPWALAPDGKSIAYVTAFDTADEQWGNFSPHVEVWRIPLGGDEAKKLTRFRARIYDLDWSPKGDALYAVSDLGCVHHAVWRIDLARPEQPDKLTMGEADEQRPSVSREGALLYVDNSEGVPTLMLRDLSGGTRPLSIDKLDFSVPTGQVRLRVRDGQTPIVARVSLRAEAGNYPAPPGALWRIHRGVAHFYVDGQVEFELPAGKYQLRAWHGPEYRSATMDVNVQPGQRTEQAVSLERWHNAAAKGWYAGDNHIHANYCYGEYYNTPSSMALACAGEALNMCNFMVANCDSDGVWDREFFRGQPDALSTKDVLLYWNEEYRSTVWGHMTLINLKHVVEPVFAGFKDTTNPYDIPTMTTIAERTHRQGGLVNYTHPAALVSDLYKGAYTGKGLPLHAALGHIDTMDIMGSNDEASTLLYHKLLNCGIRLAPSAGTDCFLNVVRSDLPGAERVYVKIDGAVSYQKWIDGLRKGRSFVSNGPFLEFAAGAAQPGDELKLTPKQNKLRVQATVTSAFPIERIEVLHNGKVVLVKPPAKDGLTTKLDEDVDVAASGWLALRVLGPPHADVEGPKVYAHSAPIYVVVDGKPAGSAEDARYFIEWLDRLWTTVQERDRIPGAEHKKQVEAEVERARAFYRGIAER